MRMSRWLGTPSIHPALFLLSKLTMAATWAGPLLQAMGWRLADPLAPGWLVMLLVFAGVAVVLVASDALGPALRIGLPAEETPLRTAGLYAFSRNPIYVGVYLVALAGSLYTPHPIVVASAFLTIVLHHWIVLAEERFLEQRFGDAWRYYRARVARYVGVPRAS
jgi:protein-S-isoprenylcysteine O-methyltransferase Ste14